MDITNITPDNINIVIGELERQNINVVNHVVEYATPSIVPYKCRYELPKYMENLTYENLTPYKFNEQWLFTLIKSDNTIVNKIFKLDNLDFFKMCHNKWEYIITGKKQDYKMFKLNLFNRNIFNLVYKYDSVKIFSYVVTDNVISDFLHEALNNKAYNIFSVALSMCTTLDNEDVINIIKSGEPYVSELFATHPYRTKEAIIVNVEWLKDTFSTLNIKVNTPLHMFIKYVIELNTHNNELCTIITNKTDIINVLKTKKHDLEKENNKLKLEIERLRPISDCDEIAQIQRENTRLVLEKYDLNKKLINEQSEFRNYKIENNYKNEHNLLNMIEKLEKKLCSKEIRDIVSIYIDSYQQIELLIKYKKIELIPIECVIRTSNIYLLTKMFCDVDKRIYNYNKNYIVIIQSSDENNKDLVYNQYTKKQISKIIIKQESLYGLKCLTSYKYTFDDSDVNVAIQCKCMNTFKYVVDHASIKFAIGTCRTALKLKRYDRIQYIYDKYKCNSRLISVLKEKKLII